MDSEDAVRRVRLLEKSVRLLLEAVRADVVTTTIVPAGGGRYIGVNYFSQPSDTLLGILAGLEQIIRADQRASPFLAMSQGAHAGRLLLAEYRDDLKRAISELASALQPFDDNGLRRCCVTQPRLVPRRQIPAPSAGALSPMHASMRLLCAAYGSG